jgi:hypothetical protein
MQAILGAFPIPTGPDLGNGLAPFTGSFSNPSGLDATSLRVDYSLSKRWNLFARYNYSPSTSDVRGSTVVGQGSLSLSTISKFKNTTQTLTFGATTVISPRMASEFHFNYSHVAANSVFKFDPFGGAVLFDPSLVFPAGLSLTMALLTRRYSRHLSPSLHWARSAGINNDSSIS